MATVQISRIQHRQGLSENLPQLAGGEFGWSIDTRQLFIGNGSPSMVFTEIRGMVDL